MQYITISDRKLERISYDNVKDELADKTLAETYSIRRLYIVGHKKYATLFSTITIVFLGQFVVFVSLETGMNTLQFPQFTYLIA